MSDTYSQIYIHIVFAVKGRASLIRNYWEEKLYKYITGIISNNGQKLLAINGTEDHIHFLIGLKPDCCLSALIREIKKSTNTFINSNNFCIGKFSWQSGFGAFSYSRSQINRVIHYINNQKTHHNMKSFHEEYIKLLENYDVKYKKEHLFDWIATEK